MKLTVGDRLSAKIFVSEASEEELLTLRSLLTFRDRQTEFLLTRHKKNRRFREGDPEKWQAELERLEVERNRCILFEEDDESGTPVVWTYAGLAEDVQLAVPGTASEQLVRYPTPDSVPWAKVPEHENRPYQDEAVSALLAAKHGAVQLPTGSGKSTVIRQLAHDLGHQTLVMAPTVSIARQLHSSFVKYFGQRSVGLFGDGRKDVGKKFTIGIGASLTRIKPGTAEYEFFERTVVFMADESHMCPADTLERVCLGPFRVAPYRFFFSATQTRTDGAELVLKGITGPVVYERSFCEMVDGGYLARPFFRMVKCPSSNFYYSDDAGKMTQQHLYYNPVVLRKAAAVADGLARQGQRVLVLVDEIEQFTRLLPLLHVEARFAHGGVTKANAGKLPAQYHKSDPMALVRAFDAGEFPVLVGTSCISVGTDILSPEAVLYLQGGTSAIQVPQAVGRGTRRGFTYPDGHRKSCFQFVDFAPVVTNKEVSDAVKGGRQSSPHRHALARARMYESMYPGSLSWVE